MESKEELQRRIAWLESRLDQAESELNHLNQLLLTCGFPEGIRTLESTIEDLLAEVEDLRLPPDDLPPTQTYSPFG